MYIPQRTTQREKQTGLAKVRTRLARLNTCHKAELRRRAVEQREMKEEECAHMYLFPYLVEVAQQQRALFPSALGGGQVPVLEEALRLLVD